MARGEPRRQAAEERRRRATAAAWSIAAHLGAAVALACLARLAPAVTRVTAPAPVPVPVTVVSVGGAAAVRDARDSSPVAETPRAATAGASIGASAAGVSTGPPTDRGRTDAATAAGAGAARSRGRDREGASRAAGARPAHGEARPRAVGAEGRGGDDARGPGAAPPVGNAAVDLFPSDLLARQVATAAAAGAWRGTDGRGREAEGRPAGDRRPGTARDDAAGGAGDARRGGARDGRGGEGRGAEGPGDRVQRWAREAAGEADVRSGRVDPAWRDAERLVTELYHPRATQITDESPTITLWRQWRVATPTSGGPTDGAARAIDPSAGGLESLGAEQYAAARQSIERPAGWSATEVEAVVAADGTLESVRVVAPSGRRALDRQALDAVRRTLTLRPVRDPRGRVVARLSVEAAVVACVPPVGPVLGPGGVVAGGAVDVIGLVTKWIARKPGERGREVRTRVRLRSVSPASD